MSSVKEKDFPRKTKANPARRLNLVTPSVTETGSVQPDQLKFWQTMLDALEPVAMLLRQDTREIVACNQAARKQGITLGSTCFQSWFKRESPCPWCRAPEAWETGKTVRCQTDDDGRSWDSHWVSISDELYLHYAHDITIEKQNQTALQEIKERYQSVVEGTRDLVTIVDTDGRFTYVNHSAKEFFGLEPEDCVGKLAFDFVHPDDRENTTNSFEGWLRDKPNSFTFENRQISITGDIRHALWTINPSYDTNGNLLRIGGIARDITERMRAEEELRRSEQIVSSSTDMLALLDINFVYLAVNAKYAETFSKSAEEFVGATTVEIFGDEVFQTVIRPHAEKCLRGDEVHYQDWFDFPTSGARYMEITYNPIVGPGNEVHRFTVNARDITESKRAEEKLEIQTHDLGERVKELRGLYGLSKLTTDTGLTTDQVFQKAAELLPPAWHYPEITCGRIVVNRKEYTTDNYADTIWKQSADIVVSGVPVGEIDVAYLEEMPELFEGPFLREERSLIDGMAQMMGQYIERLQNESRLRESNARLVEEQLALESKNTALSEVMEHVDREKKDTGFQIQSNIDRLVIPMIAKLEAQASEAQKPFLSILKTTLDEITSPFVSRLEKDWTSLSPREVEICNLIKNGLSSKDIATALNTSEATVRTQRKTIRKKLGLSKSNTNLANYLQQV